LVAPTFIWFDASGDQWDTKITPKGRIKAINQGQVAAIGAVLDSGLSLNFKG
jgi:hypothetical protein